MGNSDLRDIIGAIALAAIGVVVLFMSFGYGIGTISRMGAGFFPMILGAVLIVLALFIAAPALRRPGRLTRPSWRPLVGIGLAIATFALITETLGFLPAVATAAAVTAASDQDTRLLSALLLVAVLVLSTWLIFIVGLGLPVPAFKDFL